MVRWKLLTTLNVKLDSLETEKSKYYPERQSNKLNAQRFYTAISILTTAKKHTNNITILTPDTKITKKKS